MKKIIIKKMLIYTRKRISEDGCKNLYVLKVDNFEQSSDDYIHEKKLQKKISKVKGILVEEGFIELSF